MKKIAIIGGGIIGMTLANYLDTQQFEITLYDDGIGQATKASAGIISPWLSKRRNKKWYQLAKDGAAFFPKLVKDFELGTSVYNQTGTVIFRKDDELDALYDFARGIDNRRVSSSQIRKSISTENTFPKDLRGWKDCESELRTIYFEFLRRANRFIERESQKTFPAFHCFVKIKYADFQSTTIERTFPDASWKRFSSLFRERYDENRKVRLLGAGIRLDKISEDVDSMQTDLF